MKQGWFCESYLWIILIGQSDIVKVITFWSLPNVLFTQPNSCSEQVPHQDLSKPDKSGYSGNASKSSDSGQCPARVDIGSSRSEKWNENLVHSFREVKSEMKISFTHFENEKWNENALRSRSRVKSEMRMSQNRDREWKVNWKCLEIEIEKWNFSRIFEKFLRIKKSRKFKILLQMLFI